MFCQTQNYLNCPYHHLLYLTLKTPFFTGASKMNFWSNVNSARDSIYGPSCLSDVSVAYTMIRNKIFDL